MYIQINSEGLLPQEVRASLKGLLALALAGMRSDHSDPAAIRAGAVVVGMIAKYYDAELSRLTPGAGTPAKASRRRPFRVGRKRPARGR